MGSDELRTQLTGPGGLFEVVVEALHGVPTKTYRHRLRSLREVATLADARGAEPFLSFGERRIAFSAVRAIGNAYGLTETSSVAT